METFTPTKEMISAANTVFVAMAYTETVKEVIDRIENDILEKYRYKWDLDKCRIRNGINEFIDYHGEYCKRPNDTYLISDKDFGHYLTEKHAAMIKAGFKVEFGYCPLLIAQSLQNDAERLLIDIMEPFTGMDFKRILNTVNSLKNVKKILDLTLRLLAPYIKNKKAA